MSLTSHIGYGQFQVGDFLPGEVGARFDGSLFLVCDPQPPLTDHVLYTDLLNAALQELNWHELADAFLEE